jgi:CheY-like chemotaxis protein
MRNAALQPLSILVVDDHQDTAALLQRALIRTGHQVVTATSAAAAKALARGIQSDVLICDIGLPDGDGSEVLGYIRELYPVKAIALTGYGTDADIKRFSDAGFDEVLLKPIELARLEALIAKMTASPPVPPAGSGLV